MSIKTLVNAVKKDLTDLFFEDYFKLKDLIDPMTGLAPIHLAIILGNLEMVRYLLEEKVSIFQEVSHTDEYESKHLTTLIPSQIAVVYQRWEILSLLVANGFKLDYQFGKYYYKTLLEWVFYYPYFNVKSSKLLMLRCQITNRILDICGHPSLDDIYHLLKHFNSRNLENGTPEVAQVNHLIKRLVFDGLDTRGFPLIRSSIDGKCLAELLNSRILPHQVLNWIRFNQDKFKTIICCSGMSLIETIYLDKKIGKHRQVFDRLISLKLVDLSDLNLELSDGARDFVIKLKDKFLYDAFEKSPKRLIDAVIWTNQFWLDYGLFSDLDHQKRIDFLSGFTFPEPNQELILNLVTKFSQFRSTGYSGWLCTQMIQYYLIRFPNLKIENLPFNCCSLLNFCCKYSFSFKSLILRILDSDRNVVNAVFPCSESTKCGLPLERAIRYDLKQLVKLFLNRGADQNIVVKLAVDGQMTSEMFRSIIPKTYQSFQENFKGHFWETLKPVYRFSLDGSLLKKLDKIKPLDLVTRQEPITMDDLQEIESSRLVIINSVPWDIENFIQYLTKVTRGANAFDLKHSLAGRPLYIDDELQPMYDLNIPFSSTFLSENRDLIRGETSKYGDLIKSYVEIGSILYQIDRTEFEQLYQIGSILWARKKPFDDAIQNVLTVDQISDWKKYSQKMGSTDMPSNLPESISRKLTDLKFIQMANLDIWLGKSNQSSLKAISRICFPYNTQGTALQNEINSVLNGEGCVMVLGSYICAGYNKTQIIWEKLISN